MGRIRKFKECDGEDRRVWERKIWRRNTENKNKERKRDEVESRRGELPERYTAKLLYGWDDKKFDKEDWKKLERNWNRWKKERKEGEKEYMKKLEESLE